MSRKKAAVTAPLSCSKETTGRSAGGRITGTSRIPTCSSPASWAAYRGGDSNRQTTRASPGWSSATGSEARERSEEHTSELQSHHDLVCRLLLEKKKKSK